MMFVYTEVGNLMMQMIGKGQQSKAQGCEKLFSEIILSIGWVSTGYQIVSVSWLLFTVVNMAVQITANALPEHVDTP